MADSKTTALAALAPPLTTDIVYGVSDPGGTPASKKITLAALQSTIVRAGAILVSANDAPARYKAITDYQCDNTADDVEINAALTALGATGGIVQLSPGTFTIAAPVALPAKAIVRGSGRAATTVQAAAAYDNNLFTLGNLNNVLEHLTITLPASLATKHGVVVTGGNCSLEHLVIGGGGNTTPFAISLESVFDFNLFQIQMLVGTNGIQIYDTASVFSYGNATVDQVEVRGTVAGTTDWLIQGNGGKLQDLIRFGYVSGLHTTGAAAVGSIGMHLVKCSYCNFGVLDLESQDTSLVMEGSGGNVIGVIYADNAITLDATSGYNTFIGGRMVGAYTDGGTNNLRYNVH